MSMHRTSAWFAALWGFAPLAAAVDFSYSGYATLGYARSDRDYGYQRFIDASGTFRRDSVAGLQIDGKFFDTLGATVQVKLAPAAANDRQYDGTISWAFLTYRPSNDWLFRVGKQRIPLYLYSENYDVGATYDFARLPTEMYSLAPSNDAVSISFSKNWATHGGDFALDGYWGSSKNDFRFWLRDSIPALQSSGAQFTTLEFSGGGLVLSYKSADLLIRAGLHRADVQRHDGGSIPTGYPFVEVAPGVGYYQVDSTLPGPGLPAVRRVTNTTLTLGAELALPAGFRVVTEVARSTVPQSELAPQGTRGYAALLRRVGPWTPYVSYAFLRSTSATLDLYNQVNENTVPAFIPGAALLNASQRAGAEQIIAFDQASVALGTSYSFSGTSKFKAEYLRSKIGAVSNLVDAPPGSNIRHQVINVLSFSYSVVF